MTDHSPGAFAAKTYRHNRRWTQLRQTNDDCSSNRCRDVGLSEVVAFEQERLARRFRQGVGKAVAEIQARAMATFAEFRVCLTRQVRLLFRSQAR